MKTTEQLQEKASKVIDLLSDCNVAEKFHIIESLYFSLKDTMKAEGMEVIRGRETK